MVYNNKVVMMADPVLWLLLGVLGKYFKREYHTMVLIHSGLWFGFCQIFLLL